MDGSWHDARATDDIPYVTYDEELRAWRGLWRLLGIAFVLAVVAAFTGLCYLAYRSQPGWWSP